MSGIITDSKIQIGLLSVSVLLCCSFSSFGATPQQPPEQSATSVNKEALVVPPSVNQSLEESPGKAEKKKAPKEGVKVTTVGPAPANAPVKLKRTQKQLSHPKNITTDEEWIPWTDK